LFDPHQQLKHVDAAFERVGLAESMVIA